MEIFACLQRILFFSGAGQMSPNPVHTQCQYGSDYQCGDGCPDRGDGITGYPAQQQDIAEHVIIKIAVAQLTLSICSNCRNPSVTHGVTINQKPDECAKTRIFAD
jgi:hypothetical protein